MAWSAPLVIRTPTKSRMSPDVIGRVVAKKDPASSSAFSSPLHDIGTLFERKEQPPPLPSSSIFFPPPPPPFLAFWLRSQEFGRKRKRIEGRRGKESTLRGEASSPESWNFLRRIEVRRRRRTRRRRWSTILISDTFHERKKKK